VIGVWVLEIGDNYQGLIRQINLQLKLLGIDAKILK